MCIDIVLSFAFFFPVDTFNLVRFGGLRFYSGSKTDIQKKEIGRAGHHLVTLRSSKIDVGKRF